MHALWRPIHLARPDRYIMRRDVNDSKEMKYAASISPQKGLPCPSMPETKDFFHQFVATLCVMDTEELEVFKFQVVVGPPLQGGD